MTFQLFVFLVFALTLLGAATAVITVRNPVNAALFLVLAFFSSAGIWLLLEAEFLAITLVLVYVGAVMVLFLFVVMMLDMNLAPITEGFASYLPVAVGVGLIMSVELILVLSRDFFSAEQFPQPTPKPADHSNTEVLGELIYTEYLYPFEIAAVILLVAIVAAISLTMRKRPQTKYQDPSEQIKVSKADRLRVVSMDAEEKP